MDGGIPKVGGWLNAQRADRAQAKKDREREEQADFAKAMEHGGSAETSAELESDEIKSHPQSPSMGYPSDDEAGRSLDLKA